MEIDLEQLDTLVVDMSKYPSAELHIKYKNESYVEKIKFSTHEKANHALRQINAEWHKVLERRYNDKTQKLSTRSY